MRPEGEIFITGGHGFIGSRVVARLVDRGFGVRCLVRSSSRTERIDHLPVSTVVGDIRDGDGLEAAMKGCSGVIHLAAISNWAGIGSRSVSQVTVDGSRNVFNAALRVGGLPTVFVSSSAAIGCLKEPRPLSERDRLTLNEIRHVYAAAKRRAEEIAGGFAHRGLPLVTVNPSEVYGPDDTTMVTAGTLRDFIRRKPCMVTRGGTNVVHVEDVAAGILAAYERGQPGERYILGGDNLTFREIAVTAREAAGRNGPILTVSERFVRTAVFLQRYFRVPLRLNPHALEYAFWYWYMDNSRAKRELGVAFRPAREAIRDTVDWLGKTGRL